jgi:hydroxymethylglutaryl-CoA reductase
MQDQQAVKGFSKMSREEKINWLTTMISDEELSSFLQTFRIPDTGLQEKFESFSENTLSNFHIPWGIVPNVLVDGHMYHVPVAIEESSVVAAASKAASFWAERGGFNTLFVSSIKRGQIHFMYYGDQEQLRINFDCVSEILKKAVSHLTASMEQRGGGVVSLQLKRMTGLPSEYNQIVLEAKTMDSMGANFLNSLLEEMGRVLPDAIRKCVGKGKVDVVMAILSNFTPDSIVRVLVETPVEKLTWHKEMSPERFAQRMKWAADIAIHDRSRAATHNKGIFNGVDAVVLATGNDFRAVEAAGHSFAVRKGKYSGLSRVEIENNNFSMQLDIPLSLGTVGGLTSLHPLAAKSLRILGNPDARTLMKIAASVGLATNFAAMASLVTTGIQKGHMKMHLQNIINSLEIKPQYHQKILDHFRESTVSVAAVKEYVKTLV